MTRVSPIFIDVSDTVVTTFITLQHWIVTVILKAGLKTGVQSWKPALKVTVKVGPSFSKSLVV